MGFAVNAETGDLTAKQERSRETRRKLVASCLELVDRRPFDQVTVADIAKGAGVSVGNFYRRFASKEGILPDLYAVYEERFAAFAESFSEGAPIAQAAALEAVEASYDVPLARGLELERSYYDQTLRSDDRLEALAAFAAKRKPEFEGR